MKRTKSWKFAKYGCLILGVLFALYLLFIYGLSLHKTAHRPHTSYSLSETDTQELLIKLSPVSDETEIIKLCNDFACEKLSFYRKNNLKMRKANCVGYAQYTAALLNYAFKYKSLRSKARTVVGQVHLYGFNLHPLAMAIMPTNHKSFFKDHDFVEISKENGDIIFIDSSLSDLLGKSFI